MVLSVVSLIVTVVGFFASLKFYRDGVELQGKANDALTKLEEKTQFIQTQVGGMFDKTLEAAIGKREALSESFAELSEQLEATKSKIIEESLAQIGAAGEQERTRLEKVVDRQIELLRQKVETTRESAEDITHEYNKFRLSRSESRIAAAFKNNNEELTLDEIADRVGITKQQASIIIQALARKEIVAGKYYQNEEGGRPIAKYRLLLTIFTDS